MKRMRKFVSVFVLLAFVVGVIPANRAKALADINTVTLVTATSTSATISWSVSEAQQYAAERQRTLVGFRLTYWNAFDSNSNESVAATVDAATGTYTYANMSPTGYYKLYVYALTRGIDGTIVENAYWTAITYDASEYGGATSGSGSTGGITTGNGGTDYNSVVNAIVSNATISGVSYNQYGFGKKKGLSVKWKGYTDVSGYQANLYNRKGKLIESQMIQNQFQNYCTFNKANTKNCYYVKVRCFYTANGITSWSKWSQNFNAVPQARITSGKKAIRSRSIKLTWKKVSGAVNYVIYARKGGTKKWKKVKTLSSKKSKYTFTKLKGKRIRVKAVGYDLQVRTIGKINGKKVKSTSVYYTNYYRI